MVPQKAKKLFMVPGDTCRPLSSSHVLETVQGMGALQRSLARGWPRTWILLLLGPWCAEGLWGPQADSEVADADEHLLICEEVAFMPTAS